MIDIHCHLIPGIDDGPTTYAESFQLAQALVADGVTHVVCTPHVFPGRFENRRSSIQDDFAVLQRRLAEDGVALSLSWAGEVRLTPEALDLLAIHELPFLGQLKDEHTMLLELPDGQIPMGADQFVDRLIRHRIRPVIVHPERNRALIDDPDKLEDFVDMGCFVQLTASSVSGHFGSRVQAAAQAFLDEGWVHAVASDSHNLGGRKPRMTAAAEWLRTHYGDQTARRLTWAGPAMLSGRTLSVVDGDTLPYTLG
jgi:protein-tyrosine phosphatase